MVGLVVCQFSSTKDMICLARFGTVKYFKVEWYNFRLQDDKECPEFPDSRSRHNLHLKYRVTESFESEVECNRVDRI